MALTLTLAPDKASYAPGETVTVTATYSDAASSFTVHLTGTAQDPAGNTATATASYAVVPASAPQIAVTVTDDQGGSYARQSDANGVATFTGTAPAAPAPASGYGGTEPSPAVSGPSLSWQGYTWETEDWGTVPGQPKAANLAVTSAGALALTTQEISGFYAGAEADSARGDTGIAGNTSTWGYGTYTWTIAADLTTMPPGLCLGLFTFWSTAKGGPAGQKEIDIEYYSAGTIPGAPGFFQFGFYQDSPAGVTGVPAGHTLVPGSQFALPAGHAQLCAQIIWLPGKITWNLYSGNTLGTLLATVTAVQGESYTYAQPYGGNQFSGTVNIPATGKQQVIMNLWCPGGTPPPGNPQVQVPLISFSYVPA